MKNTTSIVKEVEKEIADAKSLVDCSTGERVNSENIRIFLQCSDTLVYEKKKTKMLS